MFLLSPSLCSLSLYFLCLYRFSLSAASSRTYICFQRFLLLFLKNYLGANKLPNILFPRCKTQKTTLLIFGRRRTSFRLDFNETWQHTSSYEIVNHMPNFSSHSTRCHRISRTFRTEKPIPILSKLNYTIQYYRNKIPGIFESIRS